MCTKDMLLCRVSLYDVRQPYDLHGHCIKPFKFLLSKDNGMTCTALEGRLRTKLYDKRDDFNFVIVATFQQHLHMEYISLS